MKRFILGAFVLTVLNFAVLSQSATEGKIEYQKGEKVAATIELPYSPDIVEGALRENFNKIGVKEEILKGMQVFKGARLTPTDGEVVDLYFKVDKKSRKDDNISVVNLILGRPNENVSLRTADDAFRIEDAKSFLNKLLPIVEAYNLELSIASQEEVIKKTEKKLKNIEDDYKDIQKKIKDLEERLGRNKKEQEAMNAEIIKQRIVRDALLAKRVVSAN